VSLNKSGQKEIEVSSSVEHLKALVCHFENAIEMSNDVKFVKALQKNARANPAWEQVIEMLRQKRGMSAQISNKCEICIE
jgi:hypothetical protein